MPVFVVPSKRYLYTTPYVSATRALPLPSAFILLCSSRTPPLQGRRQAKSAKFTSPFPTFWYCLLGSRHNQLHARVVRAASAASTLRPGGRFVQSAATLPLDVSQSIVPSLLRTLSTRLPAFLHSFLSICLPPNHLTDSSRQFSTQMCPDNDPRKKKLRNAGKRKKNKERKKSK